MKRYKRIKTKSKRKPRKLLPDERTARQREEWYRKGWSDAQQTIMKAREVLDRVDVKNAQGRFTCSCCGRAY